MTVEVASFIADLVTTNPPSGDPKSEGDDHLRLIKTTLQATLPNLAGRFGRTQSKATNYDLVAGDNTSVIIVTAGGVTIGTAAAAGSFGNGFFVWIIAANGAVVVDPNGAETVNGASTATMVSGAAALLVCTGTNWRLVQVTDNFPDSTFKILDDADTTKAWQVQVAGVTAGQTRVATVPDYDHALPNVPVGCIMDYAGATAPTGWLECDGASLSRTTYAALFAAIGTTWGSVDGNSFNIPDLRGRTAIGRGSGATIEAVSGTASSGNVPVATNVDKWITGQLVTVSNLSGFSGISNGNYYLIRINSGAVAFATTLANAQILNKVSVSGTGSLTLTHNYNSRALGVVGGEETHAMSILDLLAHTHNYVFPQAGASTGATPVVSSGVSTATSSTGGNEAMNNMQPFAAVMKIIRAL